MLCVRFTALEPLHFTITSLVSIQTPPKASVLTTAFLTLFLNVFSLQGKDASMPAGKLFQSFVVLFTKEYLPTSGPYLLLLTFHI